MNRIYEIYLLHKPNQDIQPKFITCLMLRFLIQGKTLTRGKLGAVSPTKMWTGKSLEAPCAALPLCLEYFFWAVDLTNPHLIQTKCLSKNELILLMEDTPAPVDMVNIPLFTWFYTSHFFHQQYPSLFPGATIQNLQNLPHLWSWQAFRDSTKTAAFKPCNAGTPCTGTSMISVSGWSTSRVVHCWIGVCVCVKKYTSWDVYIYLHTHLLVQ